MSILRDDLTPWVEDRAQYMMIQDRYPYRVFHRTVSDGTLTAIVAIERNAGWLLTMSHLQSKHRRSRLPNWLEITHAREVLLPEDIGFVMHLPPLTSDDFVALHLTAVTLTQYPAPPVDFPTVVG